MLPESETDPLKILNQEIEQQNPSEFDIDQLVKEGVARKDLPIPGQTRTEKAKTTKKVSKREQHEIDASGLVQLVATEMIKLCHICGKSSRVGQLLQCDFCPLLYHLDCLNPPLTNLPRSKWMCPAHPEKFFNGTQELFNSQKVQIHDLFNSPVDADEVIKQLLTKRNSLKVTNRVLDRTSVSVANLRAVKSRKRTRPSIVPTGVKRLYRQYRDAKILAANKDVAMFVDSMAKLSEDINQNYTPADEEEEEPELVKKEPKSEAEQLFDAAFADKVKPDSGRSSPKFNAVLCPVGVDAKPFLINQTLVKIGSRSDCEVQIEPGECAAIGPIHAVLYRDGQDHWEILNYSPNGIIVDGVRHGLSPDPGDDSDVGSEPEEPETNAEFEELIDSSCYSPTKLPPGQSRRAPDTLVSDRVRPYEPLDPAELDLMKERIHSTQGTLVCNDDKTLTWRSEGAAPVPQKRRKRAKEKPSCVCADLEPGWESAAPLSHGSLLEIGCHQFLFAIQ